MEFVSMRGPLKKMPIVIVHMDIIVRIDTNAIEISIETNDHIVFDLLKQ